MSDDLHYGRYRLPHSTRRTSHEFPLSNRTLLEQQEYEPSVALRAEYLRLDIERLARELSEGSKLSDESFKFTETNPFTRIDTITNPLTMWMQYAKSKQSYVGGAKLCKPSLNL